MKLKSILLTAAATVSLATATMAQVPNYVPTNGLVGWWPFNSNANDESGNGNNGTVNGATLTTDRFGNTNNAYDFNGLTDDITFQQLFPFNSSNNASISIWLNGLTPPSGIQGTYLKSRIDQPDNNRFNLFVNPVNQDLKLNVDYREPNFNIHILNIDTIPTGNWINFVLTRQNNTYSTFINGQLASISVDNTPVLPNSIGWVLGNDPSSVMDYAGKIDDIGLWNRALTQQEITDLYNAVNCANNTAITPQTNSLATGNTATYTASTTDTNPSYVWQSDFGQGFQTLNNFGNYSGANTATLNIANVQLSEHNQPIRVISTSGNCIDTSNVAVINILDTCITNVTVYDTLLTTVTDTLVINTQITGINPPNNLNTLKVFPNPASTHITIDYGNFNAMSGYTLTIVNSVGQTVFTTPINQQTSYIDLSTWSGTGIYYVQLIDPQNNTIENRKIVIQ